MSIIRKRVPRVDDVKITSLVKDLLFPYTLRSTPGLTFERLDLRRRLRKGITFIAENAPRKPIGFIHLIRRSDQLWIDMLAVDPAVQGGGSGSKLLARGEEFARRKKCSEVLLFVDKENRRAQHFYDNRGYRYVRFEPTINCYVLAKRLGADA